eukprot:296784_1
MNLLLERKQSKSHLPLNVKDEGNIKFKKQDLPSRKNYQNKVAETDSFSVICITYVRVRYNQLSSQTFELIISIILAFISIIGIIINAISLIKYFRNQLEKEDVLYFGSVGTL